MKTGISIHLCWLSHPDFVQTRSAVLRSFRRLPFSNMGAALSHATTMLHCPLPTSPCTAHPPHSSRFPVPQQAARLPGAPHAAAHEGRLPGGADAAQGEPGLAACCSRPPDLPIARSLGTTLCSAGSEHGALFSKPRVHPEPREGNVRGMCRHAAGRRQLLLAFRPAPVPQITRRLACRMTPLQRQLYKDILAKEWDRVHAMGERCRVNAKGEHAPAGSFRAPPPPPLYPNPRPPTHPNNPTPPPPLYPPARHTLQLRTGWRRRA